MKQHFFLHDEWIGFREIPTWASIGADPHIASSYLLICPKCAAIWGKVMHEHEGAYCQFVSSHCIKHAIFPSDATFTMYADCEGHPRDPRGNDLPISVLRHDVVSLATFYLANPDKCYIDLPELVCPTTTQ